MHSITCQENASNTLYDRYVRTRPRPNQSAETESATGPSRCDVGSEVADDLVNVPTVVEPGVSGIANGDFRCDCDAVFKSNRGPGQHKRHKHPAILNTERLAVLPRRKGEWSEYDTRKLINLTSAMVGSVSSKAVLYQRLAGMFAGRTTEGVKKRLIKAKWQDSEQLAEEQWRASMIDTIINSLTKAKELRVRSIELLKIAHDVKFARISDETARAKLETTVAECFPTRWRFQPRRPHVVRKSLSYRSICKLNYAALQKLYHTRRKNAASSALDGCWANAYRRNVTFPIRMNEYWKGIFVIESKADTRAVVGNKTEWNMLTDISSEEVQSMLRDAAGTAPKVDKVQPSDHSKWNSEVVAQMFNLMLVLESPTS
ncbi:hypothetical protein PHET_04943 [Paragonimus heterotremus]|uniref:Uncharacterized protein n=1 Tax=Paragonimus heterotremus TaxID=100268 RepID=A0A8J4SPW3_9TREM|nr:hypothetical protein PHET_04943 [Paragonimus heterotremus]